MTVSTENATTPKSTKSRYPNSSVQIQNKLKSQFEFVLRDAEESEFLVFVILYLRTHTATHTATNCNTHCNKLQHTLHHVLVCVDMEWPR